jgi:hypothetical protein
MSLDKKLEVFAIFEQKEKINANWKTKYVELWNSIFN